MNERLRTLKEVVLEEQQWVIKSPVCVKIRISQGWEVSIQKTQKSKPKRLQSCNAKWTFYSIRRELELEEDDFRPDVDSTVLIRERARDSNLE